MVREWRQPPTQQCRTTDQQYVLLHHHHSNYNWTNIIFIQPLSTICHLLYTVTLFDCHNLGSGCSECLASRLGSEFTCGWCSLSDSCEVLQECTNDVFVTEGRNCPTPFITLISPESGNHYIYILTACHDTSYILRTS